MKAFLFALALLLASCCSFSEAARSLTIKPADDPVYIVGCCVTNSIGFGSDENECSEKFCEKLKEATKDIPTTKDKVVDADKFKETHIKGEGELASVELLKKITSTTVAVAQTNGDLNLPGTATAFLQSQDSQKAKSNHFFARMAEMKRVDQEVETFNPMSPARWAKGQIKYKFIGDLARNLTMQSADDKQIIAWYADAITRWENGTCMRWIPDRTASQVDFAKSAAGSNCAGLGTGCTTVKVEIRLDGDTVAKHELGHMIGMDHTNKRSDRDTFITYDHTACVNHYSAHWVCQTGTMPGDTKTWAENICNNNVAWVKATFSVPTYNPASHLAWCTKRVCVWSWTEQYTTSAFPINASYEYGSIMHYPFDACIATKNVASAGTGSPGTSITQKDFDTVNFFYGCRALEVELYSGHVHKMWVHPDLTPDEALFDICHHLGDYCSWYGTNPQFSDGTQLSGSSGNVNTKFPANGVTRMKFVAKQQVNPRSVNFWG